YRSGSGGWVHPTAAGLRVRTAHVAQADGASGTYINRLFVQLRQYLAAYHVRDQHEYRFSLTMFRLGLAEEILQQGNLRQSRDSRQALAVQVFQHTAEQVGFALAQADLM